MPRGTQIGIMLVGCTALAVACGQTGDTSQCEELITRLKKDMRIGSELSSVDAN